MWCRLMNLACICFMTTDTEYVCMFLLVICIFFWSGECLFRFFVSFSLGYLSLYCWVVRVSYVFWNQIPYNVLYLQIYSSILWVVFDLLDSLVKCKVSWFWWRLLWWRCLSSQRFMYWRLGPWSDGVGSWGELSEVGSGGNIIPSNSIHAVTVAGFTSFFKDE